MVTAALDALLTTLQLGCFVVVSQKRRRLCVCCVCAWFWTTRVGAGGSFVRDKGDAADL